MPTQFDVLQTCALSSPFLGEIQRILNAQFDSTSQRRYRAPDMTPCPHGTKVIGSGPNKSQTG